MHDRSAKRITVDVNEEWLQTAQELLLTHTDTETVNESLRTIAMRKKAAEIADAFASVEVDFSGSADAWRYGGGRDLSRLAEDARRGLEEDARRVEVD